MWCFAYGSNMSSETFQSHRGIMPVETVPVHVPALTLTFDIYGIPYQDLAISSISRIKQMSGAGGQSAWTTPSSPAKHGTACLVSWENYVSIVGSEGGGSAYKEVEVLAECILEGSGFDSMDRKKTTLRVITLTRAYGPTIPRIASKRYKVNTSLLFSL